MTADLTPLLDRQKALRLQILWSALALAAVAVVVVALFGIGTKSGIGVFIVFSGWLRAVKSRWKRYVAARQELARATRTLERERALLRGSGERRDAAQGLAISEEGGGGELSIGPGGELSERK